MHESIRNPDARPESKLEGKAVKAVISAMERMTEEELDQAAARIEVLEREAWELRSQVRQQITFWGDQRRRTIRGRLFEFFVRGKSVEVRSAA